MQKNYNFSARNKYLANLNISMGTLKLVGVLFVCFVIIPIIGMKIIGAIWDDSNRFD
jgi:hypothetical protein